jgi:hypothetical protein
MGAIADKVATMRGCSLRQIVDEIARMEASMLDVGDDDFAKAWSIYPHKVAKPAAKRAYMAARKRGVSHEIIVNGIVTYVETKAPDRPWLNFSTFCNQERWNDRPAPVGPSVRPNGLAAERQRLQQEIANGDGRASPAGRDYPTAGRLAIGSGYDDGGNGGRLL